jgi:NADH-quinone oxidoreductase subunit A
MLREYLPVFLQVIVAILFACSALLVSVLVGKTEDLHGRKIPLRMRHAPAGDLPRFSVRFYLRQCFFILFDLEMCSTVLPWAVVYRESIKQSGLIFWSMLSFISILMIGYIYAVKKGALDWKR